VVDPLSSQMAAIDAPPRQRNGEQIEFFDTVQGAFVTPSELDALMYKESCLPLRSAAALATERLGAALEAAFTLREEMVEMVRVTVLSGGVATARNEKVRESADRLLARRQLFTTAVHYV